MEATPIPPEVHPGMELVEVDDAECVTSVLRAQPDIHETPFKSQSQSRRILRKRPQQTLVVSTPKRRFSLKPKKVVTSTSNNKSVENFYLGSKFKCPNKTSLETIYEEPLRRKDGTLKYSGAAKLRQLNFESIAKSKVKKRKTKVKKLLGGTFFKKQRMSMEEFILKLRGITTKVESEEIAALFTNCEIK